MNIDKEKIKHLAWLARIELKEDELKIYEDQINRIIDYLNILDEAELQEEPDHMVNSIYALRRDEVENKDDIFSVVINKKDRFVKAPKMS